MKGPLEYVGQYRWFNPSFYPSLCPYIHGEKTFVHISAVERAGMHSLNEGQKVSFEVASDRRTGKSSADNLRTA